MKTPEELKYIKFSCNKYIKKSLTFRIVIIYLEKDKEYFGYIEYSVNALRTQQQIDELQFVYDTMQRDLKELNNENNVTR